MTSNIKIVGLGAAGCEVLEQIYAQTQLGKDFVFCQFDPNDKTNDLDLISIVVKNSNYDKNRNSKKVVLNWNGFIESLRNIECLIFITDMISYDATLIIIHLSVDLLKESNESLKIGFVLPFKPQENQTKIYPMVGLHLFEEFCNCLLTMDEQKYFNPNRKSILKKYTIKNSYKLIQTIKSIIYVLDIEGFVKWDYYKLKELLENSGISALSFSNVTSNNRVNDAVDCVLSNSNFNRRYVEKFKKYFVFVIASEAYLTMYKYSNIIEHMNELLNPKANIENCVVIDNSLGKELQIVMITTGLIYPFPLESVLVDTVD